MLCTKNSWNLKLIKKMDHALFQDLSKPELLKVSSKMQPLSPVYSKTCELESDFNNRGETSFFRAQAQAP